jgi:uncharacterized protein with NRDE domain
MFEQFPLVIAANRDEQYERPSAAPAILETIPKVIAGRDLRAGGTWLGVNDAGLAAGILNRHLNGQNSLAADARSRGLLCMGLLGCRSAAEAANFVSAERARYNPFTLLFADRHDAFTAFNAKGKIITQKLSSGLHVFSSAAEFDLHSAKAERAYRLFDGETITARIGNGRFDEAVAALQGVLSDHTLGPGSDNPGDAICVHRESSGTVSSSVIFQDRSRSRFVTYYCAGAPCRNPFGAALDLDLS